MATIEEVKQKILDRIVLEIDAAPTLDITADIRALAQAYKDLSLADIQIMPLFDDVSDSKPTGNINYEEETNIGFCD